VPFAPETGRALEAAARGHIEGWGRGAARRWRVVPAGRIHVTLKFLGDIRPALLPGLSALLRTAAAQVRPARVEFGGWVLLPGPAAPRVLAVGVSDPAGTLPTLAEALEAGAASLRIPGEGRPFLAHVTVARTTTSRGRVTPGASSGHAALGPLAAEFVRRVALVRSTLGPDGPRYEVLDEAPLGGGAEAMA